MIDLRFITDHIFQFKEFVATLERRGYYVFLKSILTFGMFFVLSGDYSEKKELLCFLVSSYVIGLCYIIKLLVIARESQTGHFI